MLLASQYHEFVGSYYIEIIIYSVGYTQDWFKYKTLLTNGKSVPLNQIIIVFEVQPIPHRQLKTMSEKGFCLHDMHDVFSNVGGG